MKSIESDGVYTTGNGERLVNVHRASIDCYRYGCVIHNPTDPHPEFPTLWRADRGLMERTCPHGVGHPDRDAIGYIRRTRGDKAAHYESIHGCDGCCATPIEPCDTCAIPKATHPKHGAGGHTYKYPPDIPEIPDR